MTSIALAKQDFVTMRTKGRNTDCQHRASLHPSMDPPAPRESFVGQHHHRLVHDHTYASYSVKQRCPISLVNNPLEVPEVLLFPDNRRWVCPAYRRYFASLLRLRPDGPGSCDKETRRAASALELELQLVKRAAIARFFLTWETNTKVSLSCKLTTFSLSMLC